MKKHFKFKDPLDVLVIGSLYNYIFLGDMLSYWHSLFDFLEHQQKLNIVNSTVVRKLIDLSGQSVENKKQLEELQSYI